jgi:hypothetical protein
MKSSELEMCCVHASRSVSVTAVPLVTLLSLYVHLDVMADILQRSLLQCAVEYFGLSSYTNYL